MRGGEFEVGIVSQLQPALNGRPGAMQFLREVCREGGRKERRMATLDGPVEKSVANNCTFT